MKCLSTLEFIVFPSYYQITKKKLLKSIVMFYFIIKSRGID